MSRKSGRWVVYNLTEEHLLSLRFFRTSASWCAKSSIWPRKRRLNCRLYTVIWARVSKSSGFIIWVYIKYVPLTIVSASCGLARKQIEACAEKYQKLASLVPPGQYYRWVRWLEIPTFPCGCLMLRLLQVLRSLDLHHAAFDLSHCSGYLSGGGFFGYPRNRGRNVGM